MATTKYGSINDSDENLQYNEQNNNVKHILAGKPLRKWVCKLHSLV